MLIGGAGLIGAIIAFPSLMQIMKSLAGFTSRFNWQSVLPAQANALDTYYTNNATYLGDPTTLLLMLAAAMIGIYSFLSSEDAAYLDI